MLFRKIVVFLCIISPSFQEIQGSGTVKTLAYLLSKKIKDGAVQTIQNKRSEEALRYIADTLVTTMLLGCIKLMPNIIDIPPLDLDLNLSGPSHLEANGGIIKGLNYVQIQQILYVIDDNGDLLISMPITFTDLHVTYNKFQFDCWPMKMNGSADLKFIDNEVTINVKIIKISEIISKITKRDCIFHIRPVTFEGFQDIEPNIKVDGEVGHEFLTSHVFPVIAEEIKKVLLHMIDVKVTNSLYNALPESSAWVCRDSGLKELIFQSGGPVTFTSEGAEAWLNNPTVNAQDEIFKQTKADEKVWDDESSEIAEEQELNNPEDLNDGFPWLRNIGKDERLYFSDSPEEDSATLIDGNTEDATSWLSGNKEAAASWLSDNKQAMTSWLSNTKEGTTSWLQGTKQSASSWLTKLHKNEKHEANDKTEVALKDKIPPVDIVPFIY